jgi:CelD/BcsL family acetyltransferase involved in cellulose biosynthesis
VALTMSPYVLEPLSPDEASRWDDLIAPYETRQLFHQRAWLDYLAATRALRVHFWAIRQGGRTVGFFCGGILRKGPFKILGSPLKGWGTNFMGPVADRDLDGQAFLKAVDDLARRERLAVVEMESPFLEDRAFEAYDYEPADQQTYVVDLARAEPAKIWERIDLKSRQKIRKAQRLGASVHEATGGDFAAEFYDQFVEVLARKTLSPPYGPECAPVLLERLGRVGMVYGLEIKDPDGRSIATGIFPHDDRTVYYWGGASRLSGWRYSPNDLLQWAAMEAACVRGIRVYNMCGYGYFKSKFGGSLEHPRRWHKNYSLAARWARRAYHAYFERRIHLRGWWHRRALAPEGQ